MMSLAAASTDLIKTGNAAMFVRHARNPLITPHHVIPSRPDFEVIGTFNAGVTVFQGQVMLLLRVAERPAQPEAEHILAPYLSRDGELVVRRIARGDPAWDTHDPRGVHHLPTGERYLTSISHLRLARSSDGVHFRLDDRPWLEAEAPYESFGIEDARITRIGDTCYINYTAVSQYGIATSLISTRDFVNTEQHGVIFPPDNRDVTLFPERFGDMYVCYHRPMSGSFGAMNIWLATSPDLLHWGNHQPVLTAGSGRWDSGRVGGGAPPIRTDRGWLSIYHAADRQGRYCLGAFLTPHDEPGRIIARSRSPILMPEAPYETGGFFPNVIFTCGAIVQDNTLRLYYGAADERIALAEAPLDQLLDSLAAE